MANFTLAKLIADWELLSTALEPHLSDMPYLKDRAAELAGFIAQAKDMDTRQQELRGSLQETVRQRQALEKQGTSSPSADRLHPAGQSGLRQPDAPRLRPQATPAAPEEGGGRRLVARSRPAVAGWLDVAL